MALSSRGQIGTLLAESLCERILSQANLVLVDGNTLLSDEELERDDRSAAHESGIHEVHADSLQPPLTSPSRSLLLLLYV